MSLKHKRSVCFSQAVRLDQTACDVCLSQAVHLDQTACDVTSQAVCLDKTACDVCLSQAVFDRPPEMLFYITSRASQAVHESACAEANRTACVECALKRSTRCAQGSGVRAGALRCACLVRKGRTFHDPSLRLASMVRALNSINCQRNEQKARSIAGEMHNRKPFHPKFM
jgi:hypothetical protein